MSALSTLSVVISPAEHDRLRLVAKEQERSVSAEVRLAIRAYLNARETGDDSAPAAA